MKSLKFATKLLIIILGVSITSMIIVSTISYTELLNLSTYSRDANTFLGATASRESSEALTDQANYYMEMLAVARAAEVGEILQQIQSAVEAMSGFVGNLYRYPDDFAGRYVPEEVDGDELSAKIQFTSDTQEFTEEIAEEMLLLGNAEHAFSHIFAANQPYMSNAYLGSLTGLHFRWSSVNARIAGAGDTFITYQRPWCLSATAENNVGSTVWHNIRPCGITRTLLATCAKAFFDNGNVAGVVATDVHLDTLIDDILNFEIGETGFAFLLDNTGRYLAHRYREITLPEGDEVAPTAIEMAEDDEYAAVLERMVARETGIRGVVMDDVEYYIAFAPVEITGWSLGIVVARDEILLPAVAMASAIEVMAQATWADIDANISSVMFRLIVVTCIIIIVTVIFSIMISGSTTKPIMELTKGVIEVGKGDLSKKIDIDSEDEVGILAKHFNKMTDDLSEYIANLSKVTAEKERIGAELNVATQIQTSMLPCIFPAFPERDEFDIHASMLPAKEVGGDFYDFFLIDDDTLALVMADVSGKGVPAALFMVIAKTLLKNNAQYGKSPKEVFEVVNDLLCENNDAAMFVTAFMGFLDIPTGKFAFVNAGHNPPIIKRAEGRYEWLPTKPGFILAGMEGMTYSQDEIVLHSGDTIFMYTDGVTEAHNPQEDLFSDERLLDVANEYASMPLDEFLSNIKKEIDIFADGADQADDITMLAIKIS